MVAEAMEGGPAGVRGTYRRMYEGIKSGMVSYALEREYPPEFVSLLDGEIPRPDAVVEQEAEPELKGVSWAAQRRMSRSKSIALSHLQSFGSVAEVSGEESHGEGDLEDRTDTGWMPLSDRAKKRQMVDAMRARLEGMVVQEIEPKPDEVASLSASSSSSVVYEPWGPMGRWTVEQVAGWAALHGLDPRRVIESKVNGMQLAGMGSTRLRVVFDLPLLMAEYVRSKVQDELRAGRRPAPTAEEGVWSELAVTQWHVHEKRAEMEAELVGARSYRWRGRWLKLAVRYGVKPTLKEGRALGPGQCHGLNAEEILHVFTLLLEEGAEVVPEDAAFIAADIDMILPEIRAYNEEVSVGARDDIDTRHTMTALKRAVSRILKSSGRLFWAGPEWKCGRDRVVREPEPEPEPEGPIEPLPPEWERMMLRIVPHLCHSDLVELQIKLLREAIRKKWGEIHAIFFKYSTLDHWMPEPESKQSALEGHTDVMLVENFWAFCRDARLTSQKVTLGDINRGCLPELDSQHVYEELISVNDPHQTSKGNKVQHSEIQKRWNSLHAHEFGCHGSRRGVLDVVQFGECMIRIAFFHSIGTKTKRRGNFGMGFEAKGTEARLDQHFILFTEHHYAPMCLPDDVSLSGAENVALQHAEPLNTLEKWLLEFPAVQQFLLDHWKILWLVYCQFKDFAMIIDGEGLTRWQDKAQSEKGKTKRDRDTFSFNDLYIIIFHIVETWPGHGLKGKDLAGMTEDVSGNTGVMGQIHPNNLSVELTFIEFMRLFVSVGAFLYHVREARNLLDKRFRKAANEPARVLILLHDLIELFKDKMFPLFPFKLPNLFG